MNDAFASLARMRAALEEGLAVLDDAAPDDRAVAAALGRVAEEIRSGPDPVVLRERVEPSRREEFDDQLEELVRLNAVLSRAAALDRDRMVERIRSVRTSMRDLRYYGQGDAGSGGRCDMSA